jgi:hypothetical protein
VIIAAGIAKEDVYHPVSRRHRHMTLISCVSASASPISDALERPGVRQGEVAMVRHRSRAYITEELFYEYISNEFIPYVLTMRYRPGFQNEMSVLLMDSAVPHTSEGFEDG